jgi:DNA polymerase I-like protein with 3'-5' exonuclease and polymerase domains
VRLAIVFDAPRATGDPLDAGVGGAYFRRSLEACQLAANESQVETESFYAVSDAQPGGKSPPIGVVRKERERLMKELLDFAPDKILSVGAGALNALAIDAKKALAIGKERGRMRLLYGVPWVPTISHLAVMAKSDLHRDFIHDLHKVIAQPAPIPPMTIDLVIPRTTQELEAELSILDDASVVGVDVETTGLRPAWDDLLAVGFGGIYDSQFGVAVVVTKELLAADGVDEVLYDACWRATRRSVGHNFKFDMQYLSTLVGFPPKEALIGDTLVLGHLLDERSGGPQHRVRGLGLKDMVAVRYDHQYGFDFGEFYTAAEEDKDWAAMHAYLGEDVVYTARLWHDLAAEAEAESEGLMRAHDTLLMPVSRALAKIEMSGAPVDTEYLTRSIELYDERIARLERALTAALPCLTDRDVSLVKLNAPQQVADLMYDDWKMTPDVRKHGVLSLTDRSTDKDHIKAAVSKYLGTAKDREARWLRALQRLRRAVRQRSVYQTQMLERVDPDGRLRSSFLMHGTSTGRLSSRKPALQTIPATDREDALKFRPMREAFAPGPGRLWVEVDYSQLELRVAAAMSGDEGLISVFTSGRDVHQEIASAIFSKEYDQVSKAERFLAKAVSFGIIYGRGGRALATGAEMRYAEQKLGMRPWTEEQADAFIKKFLRDYPRLDAWMKDLYATVPTRGYVDSPYGRRRRFPLYPKSRGELGSIQRQAVNTPVQSAASDICLEAMVEMQEVLETLGEDGNGRPLAQVLFTVHDSICLEVEAGQVERVEEICRMIMEKDWNGVPLTVDFEFGKSWGKVGKAT